MYGIGNHFKARRAGKDRLELEIDGNKTIVLTEDLAALVRAELPKDRAQEMFSEVEEKMMMAGKARVAIEAKKDIRQGEMIVFTIDINKYLDSKGIPKGIRVTPSGLIF